MREAGTPSDAPETADQRPGFDTSKPNIARVYDYLLGGKDNFTADRAAGDMVIAAYPGIVRGVKANRAFLGRAVRYLAGDAGIRQFLDIGPGLPTASNTHEAAQSVASASRVVYVDNDPVVLSHARALLRSSPQGTAAFVDADVRDIGKIVAEAGQMLNFSEPVGVVMLAVLHFLPDDTVYDTVSALMAELASGSFVAISHIARDIEAESIAEIIRNAREGPQSAELYPRTRDEVTRLFDGLELVEPGVVALQDWRPDSDLEARNQAAAWAGVARKPLSRGVRRPSALRPSIASTSNPTTATSSGIAQPDSRTVSAVPRATWSLPQRSRRPTGLPAAASRQPDGPIPPSIGGTSPSRRQPGARPPGARHRVDNRHRYLRADGRRTGADRVADAEDAVDSLLKQGAQVVLLAGRVAAPVADEDQDRSGAERVFRSSHEGHAEPAEAAGGNQAHRTGRAGEQAAGEAVRPIAELLGGVPYPPRGSSLTRPRLLSARDAVPGETSASRATSVIAMQSRFSVGE